ncbi:hypothetical protein B5F34_06265 [Mediterranea sp. An20]|jgi:hypothetical protein|nr:hypothetical protein B5F34_06265 [Mediterranea sp. An20]
MGNEGGMSQAANFHRNSFPYSFIFLTFAEQFEANPDKGCSVMKTWGSLVLQRGIFYRFMPE